MWMLSRALIGCTLSAALISLDDLKSVIFLPFSRDGCAGRRLSPLSRASVYAVNFLITFLFYELFLQLI
jgi:hypothetical protein